MDGLWRVLARTAEPRNAVVIVTISVALAAFGWWKGREVRVGDLPPRRPRAPRRLGVQHRHRRRHYRPLLDRRRRALGDRRGAAAGVHRLGDHDHDRRLRVAHAQRRGGAVGDRVAHGRQADQRRVERGQPEVARAAAQPLVDVAAVTYIDTSTGLLNGDCSVMPVMIFTADHKAETIDRVVAAREGVPRPPRLRPGEVSARHRQRRRHGGDQRGGRRGAVPDAPVGVAATILLCLISFRSIAGTLCVILPLALVSLLSYALMAMLEIGLKTSTLPVVALRRRHRRRLRGLHLGAHGDDPQNRHAARRVVPRDVHDHGNGVLFTGLTLATGVATWIFSPPQVPGRHGHPADLHVPLQHAGAIVLLPAFAPPLPQAAQAGRVETPAQDRAVAAPDGGTGPKGPARGRTAPKYAFEST